MTTRDEARERLLVELLRPIAAASSGVSLGEPTINYVTVRQEDLRALLSPEGDGSDQPWDGNSCPSECERGHIYNGSICPVCPMEVPSLDQPRPSVCEDQGSSRDHALTDGVALDGWQPIETAPAQEDMLLYFPRKWNERRGEWTHWAMMRLGNPGSYPYRPPTHWMPLPAPPSSAMQTPDAVPGTNPKTTDKGGE